MNSAKQAPLASRDRTLFVWVAVVFFTALALRGYWVADMDAWDPKGVTTGITTGDCFDCIANRIVQNGFGPAFGPPTKPLGYPVFLAAFYKLFGRNFLLVRLTQALLDSISCLLILRIGLLLFGRRTGILAGFLAAAYPFFIRDAARISAEALFMALFLASMLFVLQASRSLRFRDILWGGVFLGLSTLAKPGPIVLVPLIVGFLGLRLWPQGRKLLVLLLSFCVVPPLMSVPWGLRNLALGYGFVTTETRGGLTFYLGNSELTVIRFVEKRVPEDWNKDLETYSSSYFYDRAFRFIRENPGTYVKLLAYKAAEFWRILPEENRNFPALVAHGFIPPLGLIGLVLGWRRARRETVFVMLLMLTFTAFFCIYNTELRYRIPLADPFLIVYAALLLTTLGGLAPLAKRGRSRLALWLPACLVLAVFPGVAGAVNLAPNPSFETADNPSFPNGWTNYAAANFYPYERVRIDDTTAFHGEKSLRIQVVPLQDVQPPFYPPYVNCYGIRSVPNLVPVSCQGEPAVYTLSAYMKTDTPGISVYAGTTRAAEDAQGKISLGTEWQRVELPFRPCAEAGGARIPLEIYFTAANADRPYTFWVDAVQVEPGEKATPFSVRTSEPERSGGSGAAQDTGKQEPGTPGKRMRCPFTAHAPVIDGRLDDPAWKDAVHAEQFVHYLSGLPEKEPTQALLMRDDQNLYVAFRVKYAAPRAPKAGTQVRDGPVWDDDAVEIFLDTRGDKVSHLQFLLNRSGTQADLKRSLDPLSQKLGEAPSSNLQWNAFWEARTRQEPDGWTAEILIPLSSLEPDRTFAPDWGINLCRDNPDREDYTCWAFPAGQFPLATARFGILEGMEATQGRPASFRVDALECAWADAPDKTFSIQGTLAPSGLRERTSYRIRVRCKETAQEKSVSWEAEPGKRAGAFVLPGFTAQEAWRVDGSDLSLEISLEENATGRPVHQWREEIVLPPLLEAYLDRDYYTREPAARLFLRVNTGGSVPLAPMRAEVSLKTPGAHLSRQVDPGENEIMIPLQGVPEGIQPVRISIRTGTGTPVAEKGLFLDRKPASPTEVKIDRKRMCLLVDGKPFLPYLFGIGSPVPWPETVRESQRLGFNGLVTRFEVFTEHHDLETIRKALDQLHAQGVRVVFWIHPDRNNRPYKEFSEDDPRILQALTDTLEKEIRLYVPAFRDHPAVLAWKFADEWWDREGTGKLYRLCKSLDPYRPAFHNQTGGRDTWRSGPVNLFQEKDLFTDILSWDVYPWGHPGGKNRMGPLVEDSVKKVMIPLALRHRIPMMFWLQMINLYDRLPLREEYLAEVYVLAMYGVRGYFTFFHKPDAEELWDAAGEVGAHWEALQEVWLAAAPGKEPVRRDGGLLYMKCAGSRGTSYVVCVNLLDEPGKLAVDLEADGEPPGRVQELLQPREIVFPEDRVLRDSVPGKSVCVYAIHTGSDHVRSD